MAKSIDKDDDQKPEPKADPPKPEPVVVKSGIVVETQGDEMIVVRGATTPGEEVWQAKKGHGAMPKMPITLYDDGSVKIGDLPVDPEQTIKFPTSESRDQGSGIR